MISSAALLVSGFLVGGFHTRGPSPSVHRAFSAATGVSLSSTDGRRLRLRVQVYQRVDELRGGVVVAGLYREVTTT